MATEAELQDLHDELKKQIGVLVARCTAIDGDIPPKLKSTIMDECKKMEERGLLILKAIDTELIRLKSEEEPPPL